MCVLLGGFPKFLVDPYYELLAWFMIIYILAPHEEAIHLEAVPFPYTIVYGNYNI